MEYICVVYSLIIILETSLLIHWRKQIKDLVSRHNETVTRIILNDDLLDASIKQISEVYGIDEEELIDILSHHRENK